MPRFPEVQVTLIRSGRKQFHIANALHMTQVKVSGIINGGIDPTDSDMEKISDYLGKPVDELFAETGQPFGIA